MSTIVNEEINGKLYFGGTELANKYTSYIEGAIETGQRCGYQICTKLKQDYEKDSIYNEIKIIPFVEDVPDVSRYSDIKLSDDLEIGWIQQNLVPTAKTCRIICILLLIILIVAIVLPIVL